MVPAASLFSSKLLLWYDTHHRDLPWRAFGNKKPDPYKIWLAEIFLQQTGVKTVAPYYANFIRLWPTVTHMAKAPLEHVRRAFAGLGYYRRVHYMHACAQQIVAVHAGQFPKTKKELMDLPGIGPYTAAAIAAIAFEEPVLAIDCNVARVLTRLFAISKVVAANSSLLHSHAQSLIPKKRNGDFAQAMIELGATVCGAKNPQCHKCPVQSYCKAYKKNLQGKLPLKKAKRIKPYRYGKVFWLARYDGAVWLRRRESGALLRGMTEIPSSPWQEISPQRLSEITSGGTTSGETISKKTPFVPSATVPDCFSGILVPWRKLKGKVSHSFTHFHLVLEVYVGTYALQHSRKNASFGQGFWSKPRDIKSHALPSLMRKVVHHVEKMEKA